MSNMQKNFEKKSALRRIRMASGGAVQGPGGPREDKVPAMLSNGEYVLPAKTVQKLGGPEELDELVQQTNDGKAPEGAEERHTTLRKLASGGFVGPLTPDDPRYLAAQNRAFAPTGAGMQSSVPPAQAAPTTPTPVAPTAPTPVEAVKPGLMGRGLRAAGGAAGYVAKNVLPAAVAQQGFGDYKADTGGVDTSAPGTLRYLAKGELGNVGASLSGGAAETLADVGSGVAKVVDGVGGFFGANPGAKAGYDSFVKEQTGGYLSPRNPNGASLAPGSSLAGAGRGFVSPPGTPTGPGPEGLVPEGRGAPTDAPVSPRSLAQSRFLSEQGVDAATQASAPVKLDINMAKPNVTDEQGRVMSEGITPKTGLRNVTQPGQFVNLGSFLGPDNIYGTSTTPGGRINSFVGAGDPNRQESQQTLDAVAKLQSDLAADKLKDAQKAEAENLARASAGNSGAINARFDAMANKVAGSYSAKGKGNENKRLLEIENQRNNALEADARNTTSIRGQTLQAQNNSAENVLKGEQTKAQSADRAATLRAQSAPKPINPLDAAKFAAERSDKARAQEETGDASVQKSVADSISRRFPNTKDDPIQAAQAEQLAAFMRSAPPAVIARIRSQDPTEREAGIQLGMNLFDQAQKANAYQADTFRGISTSGPIMPKGNARRVQLGDYAGPGSLPLSALPRYAAGVFGADAGKVQELENGATVPLSILTDDDNGTKNASKVSALQQQRELQRANEERAKMERLKQAVNK